MLEQPCDALQTTYAPELAEQLTCPATLAVPIQKPPEPVQPPGTQSLSVLQPWKFAGRTHLPDQQTPRTSPGRLQSLPFGVLPRQVHWPAEHPIPLFAQVDSPHVPQFFGSELRSTHAPLHKVSPALHRHCPALLHV